MNRTSYDACAYREDLAQSVNPLSYILDPIKYENCKKCRPELGVVGGTAVSHISGNLVDLENNLRAGDRPYTRCDEYKYQGNPAGATFVQGKEYIKPVCYPKVDTTMRHLKSCQFMDFPETPYAPSMQVSSCTKGR